MSHQLIERSPDLKRLREEGYNIEIKSNYLVINEVPYVNSNKEIGVGILAANLTLAGDITTTPNHVAYFAGSHPCHADGTEILHIKHSSSPETIDEHLTTNHSFSNQPQEGYKDYYAMMTTYIAIITGPAQTIDSKVTAKTFPVIIAPEGEDSVFKYRDTATSRAGIGTVSKKLELNKIAIVGVGGTGSYVLDLVAKTPVREIHIFDGDVFLQHNAFRSPGAPSCEELEEIPKKTAYFEKIYSSMRTGIVTHDYAIDSSSVDELAEMSFVFICMDGSKTKQLIVEKLEEHGIPFVDTGIGVQMVNEMLHGVLRTTTSTVSKREHVRKGRVSFSDDDGDNEYSRNIQIAELNALNASLAVIKWKKLFGFYKDYENEHSSMYTTDGNHMTNEDTL